MKSEPSGRVALSSPFRESRPSIRLLFFVAKMMRSAAVLLASMWLSTADASNTPGQVRWQTPITGPPGSSSWQSAPWCRDGQVLAGAKAICLDVGTNVTAFSTENGAQLWNVPVPGGADPDYFKPFVLSPDEKAVFGTMTRDQGLVKLDAATGAVKWQKSITEIWGVTELSMTADGKMLFVNSQGSPGSLHALDPGTGDRLWRYQALLPICLLLPLTLPLTRLLVPGCQFQVRAAGQQEANFPVGQKGRLCDTTSWK
jgi:outer membrane protein assembly factor BamB